MKPSGSHGIYNSFKSSATFFSTKSVRPRAEELWRLRQGASPLSLVGLQYVLYFATTKYIKSIANEAKFTLYLTGTCFLYIAST
jgi:hypothetical protein